MNDELKTKLQGLGLTEEQIAKLEEQSGATSEADVAMLNEQEILQYSGCKPVTAKKVAAAFAPAPAAVETTSSAANVLSILPALPDESSFLEMLKVGGVLKIDRTNVIATIRAAIAQQVGLYNLPDLLTRRMEQFAIEQEEPLGEAFYRLQRQLAERRYADVLAALGATGALINETRKRETLERLNTMLWPALRDFNTQLRSWMETWTQGAANPAMFAAALFTQVGGGRGVLPPGMLQPPDTGVLRDEAEAVINRINKVFAGTGIPVARALAYDATRIREVLEDPSLPSAVGAATKDQMLKTLGVEVGSDYVRLEQNVTRFALAIMEASKVTAGNEELAYFGAMYTLGAQIPWDKLGRSPSIASAAAARPPRRDPAFIRGDHPTNNEH